MRSPKKSAVKTLTRIWEDSTYESIRDAEAHNPNMRAADIVARFLDIKLFDWKGLDEARSEFGLKPFEQLFE